MSKKWGKENELKQLKSDLAALDRLIAQALSTQEKEHQAEIASKPEKVDGMENKKAEANTIDAPTIEAKKSMVAEPFEIYRPPQPAARPFRAFGT